MLPYGKRHFQLDASFYALYPYVYSVPLLVINNASLPLGLVIGPSEHQNLFNEFFSLLENYNFNFHIKDYPVLSDQGSAIKSFVISKKCLHFFCYRHLIEKIGASTYLGQITKRLLFQPTIEQYEIQLPQSLSDVNSLIDNNLIDLNALQKFASIFNLIINEGHVFQNFQTDHENGLWKREGFGVSTCSNHVERLHRTMNGKIQKNQDILKRLMIVIQEIHRYYYEFEENSTKQAESLLRKFKEKAKKKDLPTLDDCPYNCNWGIIYSHRFNTERFPCKHTARNSSVSIKPIKLQNIDSLPRCHYVFHEESYKNWLFSSSISSTTSLSEKDIRENSNNTLYNITEKGFIRQTIHELYHCFQKKIPKEDIDFEVIKEWTLATIGKSQQETMNVDFRSAFRCKMIKKYLESRNN